MIHDSWFIYNSLIHTQRKKGSKFLIWLENCFFLLFKDWADVPLYSVGGHNRNIQESLL